MTKNNTNFCPLPWVHLSLEPSGNVYSCCNTSMFKKVGNVNQNDFEEILNLGPSQEMRQSFSHNKIPNVCEICVNEEKMGHISLRQASLKKFSDINSGSKPELRYLSLRLSNQCNLACNICSSSLSTGWYKDAAKLGDFVPSEKIMAFKSREKFEEFLNNIPQSLEVLYIAGGEPFLTSEFYEVLQRLIELGKSDVEIILNTNFSTTMLKEHDGLLLLSNFKNVSLDLSLDGIGKNIEYSRHGLKWQQVLENIKQVKEKYPKIQLRLFPTISIFNIFVIDEFLSFFIDNEICGPKDIKLNFLTHPEIYSICHLSSEDKKRVESGIKVFMASLLTSKDGSKGEVQGLIKQLQGLINYLATPGDENKLQEFRQRIEKLDLVRKDSIINAIPQLAHLFK